MPRRRTPLVCQHLENLSSDLLEVYATLIKDMVHRRHGVYALYNKGKLYYVGLAVNLRSRVKAHLRDRHRGCWDRFSVYLTIDSKHLKELESLVIRIVKPEGNRQGGKFARSQNLAPMLKKRWRQYANDQWNQLTLKTRGGPKSKAKTKGANTPKAPKLHGKFAKATTLHAMYKKKKYRARVRKNGLVYYKRKLYNSPSHAAEAIRKLPTNGWLFWKYERAPGQWVRLQELRGR